MYIKKSCLIRNVIRIEMDISKCPKFFFDPAFYLTDQKFKSD